MGKRYPDLSIIIPAYNEELRITPTLERLQAFLAAGDRSYEILVVDDGSTDGTARLIESLAERIPHLRLVRSTPNRGKGAVVRLGMLEAHGDVRVMCDADGSMPPEELPKLLARLATGEYEIAIGSRYAPGAAANTSQPKWRVWWSRLCNKVIQRSLVPGVTDTQCGFKAFTAHAARDLFGRARINGWAFDLEVLALAKRRGWAIAEVGVAWTDDRRSRVNPLKDMWKVIREALTIRKNLRTGVYELPAIAS
jgi:glycosyltransferase involved in cell wall biosynthesis